jgi:hypothetical protein
VMDCKRRRTTFKINEIKFDPYVISRRYFMINITKNGVIL